jgi:uncharacterized lipoprotein YajG
MIWRSSFVALLAFVILTACADRERVNCPTPTYTKNKALRSTAVTVDTASVGSSRAIADRCP